MGLRASFSVTEDLGYPAATMHYKWPIDYSEGCAVFVDKFLEVARDLVPVDTGYLKSCLSASTFGNEIVCEDNCEYAQYVEYGTIRMSAQPYFEPAIEAAYDAAKLYWDNARDEAFTKDGRKWADEESKKMEEEINAKEAEAQRKAQRKKKKGKGKGKGSGGGSSSGSGGFLGKFFGMIAAAFIIAMVTLVSKILGEIISGKTDSGIVGSGGISVEIT